MSTVAVPSASAWTEEGIYQRMVQTIRNQQLHPGTKLGEDRLASAFGVSRTRIRPVLARLASEQVVTLTPNRGATVARPTEQEAREVFEVRRLIEPTLVAAFMARASSAMSASDSIDSAECSMSTRAKSSPAAFSKGKIAGLRIMLIQVPTCNWPRSKAARIELTRIAIPRLKLGRLIGDGLIPWPANLCRRIIRRNAPVNGRLGQCLKLWTCARRVHQMG